MVHYSMTEMFVGLQEMDDDMTFILNDSMIHELTEIHVDGSIFNNRFGLLNQGQISIHQFSINIDGTQGITSSDI